MAGADPGRRGTLSGMLNLARNLGLMAGAAGMGAVFATSVHDLMRAAPEEVAAALALTFRLTTVLVLMALALSRLQSLVANNAIVRARRP